MTQIFNFTPIVFLMSIKKIESMQEAKRISKLFSDLYDGTPWTEIRLLDILEGITAEQASKKPILNVNSIWQIVQHCLGWRINVLLKLKGIGDYTAAAIASFAFNLPHAVVDGNVFRALSRFFGIDTATDTTGGKNLFTALAICFFQALLVSFQLY